jgi:hypothetical protein
MKDLHSRPHPGLNRCDFVTEEFLSFRQLLFSIVPSFFEEEKKKTNSDAWQMSSQTSDPSMSQREIDVVIFASAYYPHFDQRLTLSLDAAFLFTEFISVIKGQIASLDSAYGYISLEKYVDIAKTRQANNLDEAERTQIYDAFKKYEKIKEQRGEFDISDAVFACYKKLESSEDNNEKYDLIYIDEVQGLAFVNS